MFGEVPTATPEANDEMKEAEPGENWIQETGEDNGSEDEDTESINSDTPFQTSSGNY